MTTRLGSIVWTSLWSLRRSPWWLTAAALAVAWTFIQPWGDFPLNDDWIYAHFAKHWAETGQIKLDAPSSPNVVGQAFVGGLITRALGFSHLFLRLATMALCLAGLWSVDALLALCNTAKPSRLLALLTLAFNPIFFYSATTFMTELWGWLPVMSAATLWFWGRAKSQNQVVPFWVSAAVGALCGLSFWTRQVCVLIYPALIGATAIRCAAHKEWKRLARSAPSLLCGIGFFGAVIAIYFPWARSTGNFRPEFAERIDHLSAFVGMAYRTQLGAIVVYMTAYFLPFLLVLCKPLRPTWRFKLLGAVGILALVLSSRALFQKTAPSDFWIGPIWTHRVFPYLVNIVWNAGIGPFTFDDTFFHDAPTPRWNGTSWAIVEWVLISASVFWVFAASKWRTFLKEKLSSWESEVPLAGALLAVGSSVAIIQVHQMEMVDRYHLPIILGLSLALPPLLTSSWTWRHAAAASVALVPLALFSVLGVHDQFRWSEARWELFEVAKAQGGTRATIQGGYEMNCWWHYENVRQAEATCGNQCRCVAGGFCCLDDEWRLGLSVLPSYALVEQRTPALLLAPSQPVILSRRAR